MFLRDASRKTAASSNPNWFWYKINWVVGNFSNGEGLKQNPLSTSSVSIFGVIM